MVDYILTRPLEVFRKTPIEAWSVGCATGEEAYTMAMLIDECMETLGLEKYYGVTGTDISKPALEKARTGLYPARKLVTLSEQIGSASCREREWSAGVSVDGEVIEL